MSYRTEFYIGGTWLCYGYRFATEAESLQYGIDTKHVPYRSVDSDEVVNYQYSNGKLIPGPGPRTIAEWFAAAGAGLFP